MSLPAAPDQAARDRIETELDVNMIVSAGAGAGKTTALVTRYMALLARRAQHGGDPDVGSIVVVTFTELAAEELKGRIRLACQRRAAEATGRGDTPERTFWLRAERSLLTAPISTIHSFCGRLLRQGSLVAQLDPDRAVLDGAQEAVLTSEVIEAFLFGAGLDQPCTQRLLVQAEAHDVRAWLAEALHDRHQWEGTPPAWDGIEPLEAARERYVAQRLALVGARLSEELDDLTGGDKWQAAVGVLQAAPPHAADDLLAKRVAVILERDGQIRDPSRPAADRLRAAMDVADLSLQGGSKKAWPTQEAFDAARLAAKQAVEGARGLRGQWPPAQDQIERTSAERSFDLDVTARALLAAYAAEKLRRNQCDFDDLLLDTRRLLEAHPELLARFRRQYEAFLIDEFQDTDRLQKDIFYRLASDGDGHLVPGKLFLVGDAKQSVYAFRGADVSVYTEALEEFRADPGQSAEVVLSANFRSHPDLTEGLFNHLFELPAVMGTGPARSPYEAVYQPMLSGRADGGADSEDPCAELRLACPPEAVDEAAPAWAIAQSRRVEAAGIAHRLHELHESQLPVWDHDRREYRAVRWSDMAVLFRARGPMASYARELRRRDVPCTEVAGRGYFRQQEVADLANLLAALACPADDLALLYALRSPLFALSDATLYWLCRDGSLRAVVMESDDVPGQLTGSEGTKLRRARAVLRRLAGLVGRGSIADLVEAALDETHFLAALAAQPGGPQLVANALKFAGQAAQADAAGWSLSEFAEYVRLMRAEQDQESQAEPERGEPDVVELSTIHMAKGRQWPVVVVADLGRRPPGGRGPAVSLRPGAGAIVRGETPEGESKPSVLARAAEERARQREEFEARRLFYVACTRAGDRLVLSAACKGGPERETALARLAEALDLDLAAAETDLTVGPLRVPLRHYDHSLLAQQPVVRPASQTARPLAEAQAEAIVAGEALARTPPDAGLVRRLSAIPPGAPARLSVNQVTELLSAPAGPRRRDLPDPWAGPLSRAQRGEVLHRAAVRLACGRAADARAVLRAACYEVCPAVAADVAVLADLLPPLERLLADERWRALTAAADVRTEVSFLLREGGLLIGGRMDLLAQHADGRLEIADYKSGHPGEDVRETIRVQLGLYALAAHQAFGRLPERVALYYLDAGEWRDAGELEPLIAEARSAVAAVCERLAAGNRPSPDTSCRLDPSGAVL